MHHMRSTRVNQLARTYLCYKASTGFGGRRTGVTMAVWRVILLFLLSLVVNKFGERWSPFGNIWRELVVLELVAVEEDKVKLGWPRVGMRAGWYETTDTTTKSISCLSVY